MRKISFLLVIYIISFVSACGGGGAGGTGTSTDGTKLAQSSGSALTGVAAVGAAIRGRIFLLDSAGQERYLDTADGSYRFSLQGLRLPVLLKAQWIDTDGAHRLYSFASDDGVANITPLTHLATGSAAGAHTLDGLYDAPSPAAFDALKAALPAALSQLQIVLQPLLVRHAVEGANPITHAFVPNHTGMDALLDSIRVRYSGNWVSLTDTASGSTLLSAPLSALASALSMRDWNSAHAAAATDTAVAISPSGTGLVSWTESSAGSSVLKARLMNGLDAGQTLSTAQASQPRLAFDGLGNALLVWLQVDSGRSQVWASRYAASTQSWGPAHSLSAATALPGASQPDLALDASGNAWVVWTQASGGLNHYDGWGVIYSAASHRWTAPALLTDGVNSAYGLRAALNATGQGLLAWQQERGDGSSNTSQAVDIWGRTIHGNGQAGAATRVNVNRSGAIAAAYVNGQLAVAANTQGGAAVLWSQRAAPSQALAVQAAQYDASLGWQAAATVSPDGSHDCYAPQIAFDAAGNAVAVWQQQTMAGAYGGSNRYSAGSGWGAAGIFVDSRYGDAFAPSLALDASGNATVAWYRWSSAGVIDVLVNRNMQGSGWNSAEQVASVGRASSMMATQPRVASNASGQTIIVWGASQASGGI